MTGCCLTFVSIQSFALTLSSWQGHWNVWFPTPRIIGIVSALILQAIFHMAGVQDCYALGPGSTLENIAMILLVPSPGE